MISRSQCASCAGGHVVVADDRVILGERSQLARVSGSRKPGAQPLLEIPPGTACGRVTVTV